MALILSLMIGSSSPAEEESVPSVVKIGLVDTITRGIPLSWTQLAMRPFKALMEEQTGMSGEVITGGDSLSLAKDLNDNKIQVGVFHGHEFAWAKQKYPKLKVIALCVNKTQQARVLLIVKASSKASCSADLKGKVIAVPRMGRAPCRIFLERRCVKPGTLPEKVFSRIDTPFLTEEALNDLIDGEVDAAVVDGAGWDEFRAKRPALVRSLRVIAESEPFPCGVIAYCPGQLSEAKVHKFSAGLVSAPTTQRGRDTLRMLRLTSFELPPTNHDSLLDAIAKAYPAPVPAK